MKPKVEIDRRNRSCPYFKKICSKNWNNCAFAIEKDREYPDGTIVNVKCCSIWLNADEHQNSNNRLTMLQKEMGEVKNAAVFHAMAQLADSVEAKNELKRIIAGQFKDVQRLT
jgi:hypothetical protein